MTPEELYSAFLDGRRLTDEERTRLSAWVDSDPSAADRVIKTTLVHEWLAGRMSILHLLEDLSTLKDPDLKEDVSEALSRFALAIESVTSSDAKPAPSNTVRQGLLAGALALAACVLLALFTRQGPGNGDAAVKKPTLRAPQAAVSSREKRPSPAPAPVVEQPAPAAAPVVATLVESLDSGAGSGSPQSGALATAGEKFVLDRGFVQWRTEEGHLLVVEAPASIAWQSASHVQLLRGKVVGKAAAGGAPLVVSTSTAEVVDLGTEFGVAQQEGRTFVAVYEGEIELTAAGGPDAGPIRVPQGFQGAANTQGLDAGGLTALRHEREFVRPDEIGLRRLAADGSIEAEAEVRWFELQRVAGLIAYQGFDESSDASHCTIGCAPRPLERGPRTRWAIDLNSPKAVWSRSIQPAPDEPVTLLFDVSSASRAALAELLDDWGTIGRAGAEVWLSWQMSPAEPDPSESYAGVAMLFGPERIRSEPLFIGRPDGERVPGLHPRDGAAITSLEIPAKGAAQTPNACSGRWVVHIRFDNPSSQVRAWCGVDPAEVAARAPHADISVRDLRFDRFSLGSGLDGAPWRFDDILVASSSEALQQALEIVAREKVATPRAPALGAEEPGS